MEKQRSSTVKSQSRIGLPRLHTVGKYSGGGLVERLCKLKEVNEACLMDVRVCSCFGRNLHIHLNQK